MLGNNLLTWYLFLGGAGAGLYLAAYVTMALNCLRPQAFSPVLMGRVWPRSLLVAVFMLACGSVCLLKDLARSEQAFYLLVKPTVSAISIGAYSLIILIACLVVLISLTYRRHDEQHLRLLLGIGAVAAVLALVVALYTGVLLQSIAAVPFWRSPLVILIFAASSLSSGIGCFALVCASAFKERTLFLNEYDVVLNIDTVIILVEAVAVIAFAVTLYMQFGPVVFTNFVLGGDVFYAFWLGFVLVGLLVPMAFYRLPFIRLKTGYRLFVAATCCSVTGAFFLRYCFMYGAAHISSIILLGV